MVKVKIECRLERPSTGSVLSTGIAFNAHDDEGRKDHVEALESLVARNFSGWRISEMQFV
jgi:hypothetical protein